MTKIKAILIVSFLVTFAAGGAAGLLVASLHHGPHGPSWLAAELDLTGAQREQMDKIWSEVMGAMGRQRFEQSRALRQERDQAIAALMTDEAIKRTKEILTPEQAAKYDALMAKQRERGFGPPHGGRRGRPTEEQGAPRGGE